MKEESSGQTYVSNGQHEPLPETTDYAHYPRPEEYLVSPDTGHTGAKLWQYTMGNGDQYAVPNKVKTVDQQNGKTN